MPIELIEENFCHCSIGKIGIDMVYIRPSSQLTTTQPLKPISGPQTAADQHQSAGDPIVSEYIPGVHPERRKKQERRQQKKGALLETRAGDRRKSDKPFISVSI